MYLKLSTWYNSWVCNFLNIIKIQKPTFPSISDYKHMFFNIGTSGRVLLQIVASNVSPRVFESIMANLATKLIAERLKGNGKGSV